MTATAGLFGKLPSRGDFVRLGLPRDFTDGWDAWWQSALVRAQAHPDWLAAWLEAPVWHFSLPPAVCGRGAALGVFMPSVDGVGRYFPLTLASVSDEGTGGWDEDFLLAAEEAGREAVAGDLSPDAVLARLRPATAHATPGQVCRFRTEGAPRVAARTEEHPALPSSDILLRMLDDRWGEP